MNGPYGFHIGFVAAFVVFVLGFVLTHRK